MISQTLFWASVLLLSHLLQRLVLSVLVTRGVKQPVILELYNRGLFGTIWQVYRRRALQGVRLGLLSVPWAIIIMALTTILIMSGVLFGGGIWLLFEHYLLLNTAYPAVAALLLGVIFPLVCLSHENP